VANAGVVNVLYGGTSGIDASGNRQFVQANAAGGTEAGDRFGAALAAGDFNGGFAADLAAGAPDEDHVREQEPPVEAFLFRVHSGGSYPAPYRSPRRLPRSSRALDRLAFEGRQLPLASRDLPQGRKGLSPASSRRSSLLTDGASGHCLVLASAAVALGPRRPAVEALHVSNAHLIRLVKPAPTRLPGRCRFTRWGGSARNPRPPLVRLARKTGGT
jgi:hypothetical protein